MDIAKVKVLLAEIERLKLENKGLAEYADSRDESIAVYRSESERLNGEIKVLKENNQKVLQAIVIKTLIQQLLKMKNEELCQLVPTNLRYCEVHKTIGVKINGEFPCCIIANLKANLNHAIEIAEKFHAYPDCYEATCKEMQELQKMGDEEFGYHGQNKVV